MEKAKQEVNVKSMEEWMAEKRPAIVFWSILSGFVGLIFIPWVVGWFHIIF